jgi:FkbM family methyltransferase
VLIEIDPEHVPDLHVTVSAALQLFARIKSIQIVFQVPTEPRLETAMALKQLCISVCPEGSSLPEIVLLPASATSEMLTLCRLALLHDNVAMNYISSWVTVHEQAAWDSAGEATFHLDPQFQGNSSLFDFSDWYRNHFGKNEYQSLTVPTLALDSVFEQTGRLDIVKIDVEGGEARVLRGMSDLLRTDQVGTIVMELVRHRMADEEWKALTATFRQLASDGWGFALLDDSGRAQRTPLEHILGVGWFDNVVISRDL